MRVETKVNIILGTVATVAVALTGFIFILAINEAFGTITPVGEPYVASYSYCSNTVYTAKAQSYCGTYTTGHEMRQKTVIKGLFFDGESSKLVDGK
jgi:hypothetical protein